MELLEEVVVGGGFDPNVNVLDAASADLPKEKLDVLLLFTAVVTGGAGAPKANTSFLLLVSPDAPKLNMPLAAALSFLGSLGAAPKVNKEEEEEEEGVVVVVVVLAA